MNAAPDRSVRPADELAIEQAFTRVWLERMAGLLLLNEQLRVEAIGFRDWQGVRVGALVTPWSVNLLVLPAPNAVLPPVRPGDTHAWSFPSGDYGFDGHDDPALGRYHQHSLLSPVAEFETHAEAVTVAQEALEAPFRPAGPARLSRRELLPGA
jgi:[NiFe] hydrogenase assembly HybE family chaperone